MDHFGGAGVSTAVKKPKGFLFIFRGGRGSSIQRGWVFLKKYYEKENFVRSTLSSGYTTILVIVYLTAEVIFKKSGFWGEGGLVFLASSNSYFCFASQSRKISNSIKYL